jgi:hypothetical protein
MPRRARYLFPAQLARRGEAIAACALAIVLAHVLLAQLTFLLAVACAAVARISRWRPWWLLCPAGAGLLWALAEGPAAAAAAFIRGPARVLGYFGAGHLAARLGHPLAAFAGVAGWLPGQAPLALVCAAAEAAALCWLDWLHTDEWAVLPARPGPLAALRRVVVVRMIRDGGVLTREGCALGVLPGTGATAELRWAELAGGALVVGADRAQVDVTGFQVVHAALRRRKPVIVLASGDPGIRQALEAACQATGTPLWQRQAGVLAPWGGVSEPARGTAATAAGTAPGTTAATAAATASASQLWGRGPSKDGKQDEETDEVLGPVVMDRCAALLAVDSPELAAHACAELALAAAQLRRVGVPGDALVWVTAGESVPAQALAATIRDGAAVGLPVIVGTTSPQVATALAELVGAVLVHRVADQALAASLAWRTGTRLVPATGAGTTTVPQPGFVARPRVAPRTLLSLGHGRFVLAVTGPRPRLLTDGLVVPAPLPAKPGRLPTRRGRTGP